MSNFLFDGFNKYKPFDVVNGEDLLKEYFSAENFYISRKRFEGDWWLDGIKNYEKHKENQNIELKGNLIFRTPDTMGEWEQKKCGFRYQRKPEYFRLLKDVRKDPAGSSLARKFYYSTTCINEVRNKSHNKFVVENEQYYYLEIPFEIIDNHLTSIVLDYPRSNWRLTTRYSQDYLIQKKFIKEVESSDDGWYPNNLIPIINKYDDKYKEVFFTGARTQESLGGYTFDEFENLSVTMKWRYKLFIQQLISTRLYGVLYPNLFHSEYQANHPRIIFGTGSHRLLNAALSGYNLGFFINKTTFNTKNRFALPEFFNGDNIIVEVDFDNKKTLFYLSSNIQKQDNFKFIGEEKYD
tara:strand:+ start:1572 stop:2627 length:1056 start_codon:yes stop_codon:yes gene_type:complete